MKKAPPLSTLKEPARKQAGKVSLSGLINRLVKADRVFENGVPVEFLPYLFFVGVLIIAYVGNSHYATKTVKQTARLKREVEELRTEYTTTKAEYMYQSKQSEVAKKVKKFGLEESANPPRKLRLNQDDE